jgi:hypothetical protein
MNTKLFLAAAMAGGLTAGLASAQTGPVISEGERSSVLSCFYECEPGLRNDLWGEITVLVLENQNALEDVAARVILLDGQATMIAQMPVPLGNEDVDMINVCRTLENAGIQAPRAGAIEVILREPPGDPADANAIGVYGWVKNFVGKFFVSQDDPFVGRIQGVGKTVCRITPPDVATVAQIQSKLDAQNPPNVPPVYVSDTGE